MTQPEDDRPGDASPWSGEGAAGTPPPGGPPYPGWSYPADPSNPYPTDPSSQGPPYQIPGAYPNVDPPAGYPPGYPPYGYPPYGYPIARPTNGMAIASMVLGILWIYWLGSILALIFGYIARNQIRERGEGGAGMATAGIVLGWIGIGFLLVFIVIGVFAAAFGA